MNGSPASMQGAASAVQGIAREHLASDEGDAALSGAAEDTSFRDLLSELEGGNAGGDNGPAGDQGATRGLRADSVAVAPLQKMIAEAGALFETLDAPSLQEAPSSGADAAPQSVALPAALMQLLALMPSASASVADTRAIGSKPDAATSFGIVGAASEGDLALAPESFPPLAIEGEAASGLPLPGIDAEDGGSLAPLAFSRLALPGSGARGRDSVQINMSVLGQETHLPVLADPSHSAELQSSVAAAVQKAYGEEGASADTETGADTAPVDEESGRVDGGKDQGKALTSRLKSVAGGEDAPLSASRPPADSRENSRFTEAATTAAPLGASGEMSSNAKPNVEPTPVSQIARRIVADLAAERPFAAFSSNEVSDRTSTGPAGSMLRVLHIKLEPESLGSITVRVALKENVISLELASARPETALAIEKDREALSKALRSAGYLVDGITSQASDGLRSSPQVPVAASADGQASLSNSPQSQQGLSNSRNQGGRQAPGYTEDKTFAPAGGVNEIRSGGSPKAGGALYV